MKNEFEAKIANLPSVSSPVTSVKGSTPKDIPVPSKPKMDAFYANRSKSSVKPIAPSLMPEYGDN